MRLFRSIHSICLCKHKKICVRMCVKGEFFFQVKLKAFYNFMINPNAQHFFILKLHKKLVIIYFSLLILQKAFCNTDFYKSSYVAAFLNTQLTNYYNQYCFKLNTDLREKLSINGFEKFVICVIFTKYQYPNFIARRYFQITLIIQHISVYSNVYCYRKFRSEII